MTALRAGLIGLGMMGQHHARVLASLPGVELVAVADPAGDPHGRAAGRECLGSIDEVVAAGVDYCIVAVPTATHLEMAVRLADAGVHMLVEKPVAATVAQAEQMAAAFEAAGLIGAVGHIERYNPALQQARARIANGDLGEIFQVATRRVGPFPSRIADVGVVKDLATHDIDSTTWVTQSPYTRIAAQTVHRSGREHEDMVAATGLLANGAITNHLVNWLSPLKERVMVITGAKGNFVADTLTADLTHYANAAIEARWDHLAGFRGVSEGDVTRFAFPKVEPLRTEHECFRDAVLGKASDIVRLRDGVTTLRVAEAMVASAQTGQAVSLA